MKNQRVGRFTISKDIIEDKPEAVKRIMGQCIIVRAECMFGGDIEYVAISDQFDKEDIGAIIPEYDALTNDNDESVLFSKINQR